MKVQASHLLAVIGALYVELEQERELRRVAEARVVELLEIAAQVSEVDVTGFYRTDGK